MLDFICVDWQSLGRDLHQWKALIKFSNFCIIHVDIKKRKSSSFSWEVFRQRLTEDKYRINCFINGKISHFVKIYQIFMCFILESLYIIFEGFKAFCRSQPTEDAQWLRESLWERVKHAKLKVRGEVEGHLDCYNSSRNHASLTQ